MKFKSKINFIELQDKEKSEWYTESSIVLDSDIVSSVKALFSQIIIDLQSIKKRKHFYKLESLNFYIDNVLSLKIGAENRNSKEDIGLKYFFDLINFKLSSVDIAKILKVHFSFLLFAAPQTTRNYVNNILLGHDLFRLSNGAQLVEILRKPSHVNIIENPLFVKKSKYFTPIKYRGL